MAGKVDEGCQLLLVRLPAQVNRQVGGWSPLHASSEVPAMSPTRVPASAKLSQASAARPAPGLRVFGERPFRTDAEVLALGFAPDGSLWSVEEGGALRGWDAATGRETAWHGLGEAATLWSFREGGRVLASAG